MLRKDIEVGRWSRKWHFSLTLCSENLLKDGWVVQKSLKTPLRNIKMTPYQMVEGLEIWRGGDGY